MKHFFLFLVLLISVSIYSQNETFGLDEIKEKIVKYGTPKFDGEKRKIAPIGKFKNNVCYISMYEKNRVYEYDLFLFDEKKNVFSPVFENFSSEGNDLYSWFAFEDKLVYSTSNLSSAEDIGYSNLYLYFNNKSYFLDSIYNVDKVIYSFFSKEKNVLFVNTFNILEDRYDAKKDDYIHIYNLQNINKNETVKDSVFCKYCSGTRLIGDRLFYTISRKDPESLFGFVNKGIYISPWNNISDTVRIASNTLFRAISSDGKYILGKRDDLSNGVCVIINVETKKYQILIGREYQKASCFYSEVEKKFAFDFGGEIVYIEYPKTYPFDALKKDNPLVPFSQSSKIRKIFEKEPF